MGIQITSIRDFRRKFENRKNQSDLFAYFLFDDRMSHEAVERFARTEFEWLDGMAYAARIFFFIFVRPDFEQDGEVVNPSPEVARMFGILPRNLPGIVLFSLLDDGKGVNDGVFLPLNAKLFEENTGHVEEIFAEVFSIIQSCRNCEDSSKNLLENLEIEIRQLRRTESMKPVWSYLQSNFTAILNFPKAILEATSKAIGEGIAKKALGG